MKIQYPGVANSVKSDLRIVKPFAIRIVGMNEVDMDKYFDEIESKLLEETDYKTGAPSLDGPVQSVRPYSQPEVPRLLPGNVVRTDYHDGLAGRPASQRIPADQSLPGIRDRIGQALWDFYQFQVHSLKQVHADPHPGNFLMRPDGTVGIFDFGCVKEIPEDFYVNYFLLVDKEVLKDEKRRHQIYTNLEMIHPTDSPKEVEFFSGLFQHMIDLLTLPFTQDHFDFGNEAYFNEIYAYMDELYNMKEIRDSKVARGSRHSLYINRTYFGLYSLLSDLKANVITGPARIQELMAARKAS